MTYRQQQLLTHQQERRGVWKSIKLAFIIVLILGCIIAVEGCSSGGGKFSPSASAQSQPSLQPSLSHPASSLATTPYIEFLGDRQAQEIVAYANSQGNSLWRCSTCQQNQLSADVLAEIPAVLAMQPRPDLVVIQTGALDLEADATERDPGLTLNVNTMAEKLTKGGMPFIISLVPNPTPASLYDPYYFNFGMEDENIAGLIPYVFLQAGAEDDLLSGLDYTQAGLGVVYPLLEQEVQMVRVQGEPVGGRK